MNTYYCTRSLLGRYLVVPTSGNEHEYSLSTRMSTLSTVFQPGTARPHLLRLPSGFRWLAASDLSFSFDFKKIFVLINHVCTLSWASDAGLGRRAGGGVVEVDSLLGNDDP